MIAPSSLFRPLTTSNSWDISSKAEMSWKTLTAPMILPVPNYGRIVDHERYILSLELLPYQGLSRH